MGRGVNKHSPNYLLRLADDPTVYYCMVPCPMCVCGLVIKKLADTGTRVLRCWERMGITPSSLRIIWISGVRMRYHHRAQHVFYSFASNINCAVVVLCHELDGLCPVGGLIDNGSGGEMVLVR